MTRALTTTTALLLVLTACASPPATGPTAAPRRVRADDVPATTVVALPAIPPTCFTDHRLGAALARPRGDATAVAHVFARIRSEVLARAPHAGMLADGIALWAATRAALRTVDVDRYVAGVLPPLPTPRRVRALEVVARICAHGLAAVWPPRP